MMVILKGCGTKEDVSFATVGNESFTSINISNPYGNIISLEPGRENGAIGFILNSEIFWLKGNPEVTMGDGTTNFEWENNGTPVLMTFRKQGNDLNFSFRLKGKQLAPSEWYINLSALPDEYFTGVFERVVDGDQDRSWDEGIKTALNLRGEKVSVKLRPTVSAYAPFFISSENYGLFVKGTWPGTIDFCKENPKQVQISFEGPELNFALMLDDGPANIVKRHALQTGPSIVPPKWVFGPWRWRDEHKNHAEYFDGSKVDAPYNSEIAEDVLMMEAYDIPFTAYWIDRPWGPGERGFDDYKIDYERLPKFEEMVSWLNEKNVEVMMWIGPFVMGEMAKTALERDYQLVSKNHISRHQVLMDFSNPEACKWWGENGPAKLVSMGVKGFKLDRADGEKLIDSLHLVTASGISYRENFNDYPRQYVKATYDAVKPVLGDDFVLFPRAQYTGSARYGATWAGDTGNSDDGLRSAVIAMQRCAVMGYPLWGSDTGGYPKRLQREATMRWMGFSCFSPIMEVGPTNNLGFWAMNYNPSFDHEILAIWRFYSKLRMSLVDYIYDQAIVASQTGMPVARPLYLDYPEQKECWENWTSYMLGNDLLVSVVWKDGKTLQEVYLPEGETWTDLWTNEEYKGGQTVEVNAPLHKIPVFMRKGSNLNLPVFNELYDESVKLTATQYNMNDLEVKEGWD